MNRSITSKYEEILLVGDDNDANLKCIFVVVLLITFQAVYFIWFH